MTKNRIELIDALRGIALAGILLLHHIEHFDFYKKPDYKMSWLVSIDQWVWNEMFLLVSGKAFALFSLLFGFSYWIMYENRKLRGETYFLRHIWRMVLLVFFGALHLIFFRGDILIMYAVLGLTLVISPFLSHRRLIFFSLILLIDPVRLYALICYFFDGAIPDFRMSYPAAKINQHLMQGSFWDIVKLNFSSGYQGVLIWSWNAGRIFTILGLFFLGTYFSKVKAFTEKPMTFWYNILYTSLILWLIFSLATHTGKQSIDDQAFKRALNGLMSTYTKLAMMFSALSLTVILWKHHQGKVWLAKFSDFGRMGLTNYILMSVIGATLYYGWGAGLYKYCGSSLTLLIGAIWLWLQMKFSSWWLNKYGQGPLEQLWRKATWVKIR